MAFNHTYSSLMLNVLKSLPLTVVHGAPLKEEKPTLRAWCSSHAKMKNPRYGVIPKTLLQTTTTTIISSYLQNNQSNNITANLILLSG